MSGCMHRPVNKTELAKLANCFPTRLSASETITILCLVIVYTGLHTQTADLLLSLLALAHCLMYSTVGAD